MRGDVNPTWPADRPGEQQGKGPGPNWSESLIERLHARIDAPSCSTPHESSWGGDSWFPPLRNLAGRRAVPSAATE